MRKTVHYQMTNKPSGMKEEEVEVKDGVETVAETATETEMNIDLSDDVKALVSSRR